MKVLSFTCRPDDEIYLKQVLPALLNKTKTQTVRPGWNDKIITAVEREVDKALKGTSFYRCGDIGHVKPPRFKAGETVRLEWKSRTSPKDSSFCSVCGKELGRESKVYGLCKHFSDALFPKILGYGKITSVYRIEMSADKSVDDPSFYVKISGETFQHTDGDVHALANRDGFRDSRTMMSWFDEQYDLGQPKQFWVYRWQWIIHLPAAEIKKSCCPVCGGNLASNSFTGSRWCGNPKCKMFRKGMEQTKPPRPSAKRRERMTGKCVICGGRLRESFYETKYCEKCYRKRFPETESKPPAPKEAGLK